MGKIELRTTQGAQSRPILVRDAQGQESRIIEGYAIVFGAESQILCDGYGYFVETIDRTALDEVKLKSFDIRCLLEHNPERLLARWRNGEGTLELSINAHGLKYRFEAPNTTDGDTALELVKRGDIFGSSFAYLADEDSVVWGKKPDGTPTRHVTNIRYMEDVSLVSRPAYMQTEVSCRDLEKRGYKPNASPQNTVRGTQGFTSAEAQKQYIQESRQAAEDVFKGILN